MIAIPQPQKISIDQYLEWEPLQKSRYEYVITMESVDFSCAIELIYEGVSFESRE